MCCCNSIKRKVVSKIRRNHLPDHHISVQNFLEIQLMNVVERQTLPYLVSQLDGQYGCVRIVHLPTI